MKKSDTLDIEDELYDVFLQINQARTAADCLNNGHFGNDISFYDKHSPALLLDDYEQGHYLNHIVIDYLYDASNAVDKLIKQLQAERESLKQAEVQ